MKKPTNYVSKTKSSKDLVAVLNGLGQTVSELYDYVMFMDKKLSHLLHEDSSLDAESKQKKDEQYQLIQEMRSIKNQMENLLKTNQNQN